jgi:hypothetical protein
MDGEFFPRFEDFEVVLRVRLIGVWIHQNRRFFLLIFVFDVYPLLLLRRGRRHVFVLLRKKLGRVLRTFLRPRAGSSKSIK